MTHHAAQMQAVGRPSVSMSALREDMAFEGLTPKQLAYCEARMSGKNMSDAYREAYDTSNSNAQTIGRKAYEVESNGKVQAKLRQLLAERGPDTSLLPPITREFVLNGIAVMAISSKKEPTQLRAWELLGKAIGLFDKNTSDETPEPTTSADIDAEIKRRLRGILAPVVEGEARRVDPSPAPEPRRQRQRKPRG